MCLPQLNMFTPNNLHPIILLKKFQTLPNMFLKRIFTWDSQELTCKTHFFGKVRLSSSTWSISHLRWQHNHSNVFFYTNDAFLVEGLVFCPKVGFSCSYHLIIGAKFLSLEYLFQIWLSLTCGLVHCLGETEVIFSLTCEAFSAWWTHLIDPIRLCRSHCLSFGPLEENWWAKFCAFPITDAMTLSTHYCVFEHWTAFALSIQLTFFGLWCMVMDPCFIHCYAPMQKILVITCKQL